MIAFRLDANEKIATGHMMRSLAIAESCRQKGQTCIFVLSEEKDVTRITENGFEYIVLNTKWDDKADELPVIKKWISTRNDLDLLIVDSYQVDGKYLSELNKLTPVMYLDDMELEKYDVSMILHYGICIDEKRYLNMYKNSATYIMLGKDYIPLRSEFRELSINSKRKKQIMITTGGTDPYSVAYSVVSECLKDNIFSNYTFDVIVGSLCTDLSKFRKLEKEFNQLIVSYDVSNMSEHMQECEIAISAGGTTLFEFCACGTPCISFSFADNQLEGTRVLSENEIIPCAGDARFDDVTLKIVEMLRQFIANRSLLENYSMKARGFVDGKGADRIATEIIERMR